MKSQFSLIKLAVVSSILWLSGATLPLGAQETTAQQTTENPVPEEHVEKVDLLAGCWSGSWVSCKNGHNGKLRATFCRINDRQVQALFTGSFARILPFRYKAVLDIVHEEEGMIQVRGSQRLGPIMGTFSYEATITADQFKATYSSRRDCGQWNMTRQDCCGCR